MPEFVDVLDVNGNPTGRSVTRADAYAQSLLHRVAVGFIMNGNDEILVQKRSMNRGRFPGYWDKSAGGVVSAGDDSWATLIRETREEIGVDVTTDDLFYAGTYKGALTYNGKTNRWFVDVFVIKTDKQVSDMTLQESEVAELRFVTPEWLSAHTDETDPEHSIIGDLAWRMVKGWLKAKF